MTDEQTVTMTLDTSAYADGDLLADRQFVTLLSETGNGRVIRGEIRAIAIVDKDDQKAAMDVVFLRTDSTLGTENDAPTISAANSENVFARLAITEGDYTDLGSRSIGYSGAIAIPFALPTNVLYFGLISKGTPTHTASGLVITIAYSLEN